MASLELELNVSIEYPTLTASTDLLLAIAAALLELGCKNVYHMREVGKNQHQKLWIAALDAKFENRGTPFGLEEFDGFLHDFDVCSLSPCQTVFAKENIGSLGLPSGDFCRRVHPGVSECEGHSVCQR